MSSSALAQCFKANRLKSFQNESSLWGRAKAMIGSSVGQIAYNKIDQFVPRDLVGSNVNSNVRSLVDAVRSGVVTTGRNNAQSMLGQVFNAAGVNPGMQPKSATDGTIFNDGIAAGTFIADKLVAGTLEELDLPGPIGSLASMAFIQHNYGRLPSLADVTTPECSPTPYAMDLLAYAPKQNFMFMVEFIFQPDYKDLGFEHSDQTQTIKFQYLCRSFQRPDVTVEYEDVNMYNFRTKVAKKLTYAPVMMKLYDDNKNSTMEFAEKYLKAMSPIANIAPDASGMMEYHGQNYGQGYKPRSGPTLPGGSGSYGGLVNNNSTILRLINVYHVFAFGRKVNSYTLINPKIQRMVMSDFSMEEQEPASLELELSYDSYFIQTNVQNIGLEQLQERSKLGERYIKKFGDG